MESMSSRPSVRDGASRVAIVATPMIMLQVKTNTSRKRCRYKKRPALSKLSAPLTKPTALTSKSMFLINTTIIKLLLLIVMNNILFASWQQATANIKMESTMAGEHGHEDGDDNHHKNWATAAAATTVHHNHHNHASIVPSAHTNVTIPHSKSGKLSTLASASPRGAYGSENIMPSSATNTFTLQEDGYSPVEEDEGAPSVGGGGGGGGERRRTRRMSDIKSPRSPRSALAPAAAAAAVAPEDQVGEAATSALATPLPLQANMMMSTIQSLVGQPLTIPCFNQTLPAEQTAIISAGHHQLQPQLQLQPSNQQRSSGHRALRTGSRGGPGGSGAGGGGGGSGSRRQIANGQGISLIVWHKDDQLNSPIFTVDARGAASLREVKQQTGLETLRGRAHLEESTRVDGRGLGLAPALVIDEATSEDVGVYTCTLEFHKAPTQTHQMRVLLINPPQNMIIRDQHQQSDHRKQQQQLLKSPISSPSSFGPYDEETHLTLTCELEDLGKPEAQVSWWQLKSVSMVPSTSSSSPLLTANQRVVAVSSGRSPLEVSPSGGDGSSTNEPDLMTTLTLQEDAHYGSSLGDDGGDDTKLSRDYFVAFHSNAAAATAATSARDQHNNLVLPFADGYRLRHWARVNTGSSGGGGSNGGRIRRTMEISSLSRANLGDEFMCLAQNNDFSSPLNSSLKINLNLKPTEIKILNKASYVLRMGQKITIECHVYGSRPAAQVRWFRGTQELDTSGSSLSPKSHNADEPHQGGHISELNRDINNNLTKISYLTLVPQLSDNQQSLACSANNPRMPNVPPISDSMTMNVQFAAQMSLQFGAGIKPDQIRLGSHVFMDCSIQSNPPIDDLTWLFNGKPVVQNASAGIIMSELSLVIQGIRIEHRGQYQCQAQNSLGKSVSNKLELRPKFEPVCDYSLTKTKHKVAVNQAVKIECNVLAEPSDDIHFVWQFNQTFGDSKDADSIVVHPLEELKQYETNFTKSYVTFMPKSKRNYGQLLCSASNSMGKQEKPCAIQVVALEIPEPVFSCFFDNFTNSSFNVHCQSSVAPGSSSSSSSSRHNYLLELYTNESSNNRAPELSPTSPKQPITHLKQRNQDGDTMDDEQTSPAPPSTNYDGDEDEQQLVNNNLHQPPLEQQQHVKRMTSELPSFHVTDLRPDTSYNVAIYVQNSKGRSMPYLQAASTLPLDPMASSSANGGGGGGGQIQFNNRLPNESGSLSERLISYWRVGDYLNGGGGGGGNGSSGDGSKLLLGVALIVLLCTITIVTITFFVVRLCRSTSSSSSSQTSRHQDRLVGRNRKRNQLRPGRSADGLDTGDKLHTYNGVGKGPAQLDENVQLNLATPSRLKVLAGSGSDTSRETNTDSTLISLFRPTVSENHNHHGNSIDRRRRLDHHQGCQLKQQVHDFMDDQQKLYNTIRRSSALNSPRADLEHQHRTSNTPQISIQSGSDCTTSNKEFQADRKSEFHDQLLIRCHQQQQQQHLGNNGSDEGGETPIYVIGRGEGGLTITGAGHQCTAAGLQTPQVRILNHPGTTSANYSCSNYSNENPMAAAFETGGVGNSRVQHNGSTQVSSSACTADSFDQTASPTVAGANLVGPILEGGPYNPLSETLDGSTESSHELPLPISFLPNSVSIPVSLAGTGMGGECPHLAANNYHHRRLSHSGFLEAQDLCLASSPILGPTTYLTLAPATEQSLRRQGAKTGHGYNQQHLHQQSTRALPYSDGSICHRQQQQQQQLVAALSNFGQPSGHYHCENSPILLDVITDNIGQQQLQHQYAQTLDDTFRRTGVGASPHQQLTGLTGRRTPSGQRISFEDDQDVTGRHSMNHQNG